MGYKTTFTLGNTEKLKDMTIKSGTYSQKFTFPFTDAEGTIPEAQCESECDMAYSISMTEFDPYDDPELATYSYQISFRQVMAAKVAPGGDDEGGGGISAIAWSCDGITLESTGYYPLVLEDIDLNPEIQFLPRNLYGWTINNDTIYTDSATPTAGDNILSETAEIITSVAGYTNCSISSVSSNSITISGTASAKK